MILRYLLRTDLPISIRLMVCLFTVAAVLIALSIHECCHGLAAYWMGDSTAKYQGRISLNPMRHLNPVGTVMLLLFGFGWANPVMVNENSFRNRKAGMVVTAAAGPVSNFIVAFLSTLLNWIFSAWAFVSSGNAILENIALFFMVVSSLNLGLGLFNLIPLPPLDGSRILAEFLPYKARYTFLSLERYSMFIFVGLIILSNYVDILGGISSFIMRGYNFAGEALARAIFGL